MPGLDRTGPVGLGAQTGRKQGQCSETTDTTMEQTPCGRGKAGRGFRNRKNNISDTDTGLGRGQRSGLGRGRRQGKQ